MHSRILPKLKRLSHAGMVMFVLLSLNSCRSSRYESVLNISFDVMNGKSLSLSDITDEISVIELELTDKNPVNPDYIIRVFKDEDYIFVAGTKDIQIYDNSGKYIRTIGSIGQGPGEYSSIVNSVIDKKNKRIFLNSNRKIICYDLEGKFLKEQFVQNGGVIKDINHIGDELLVLIEFKGKRDTKGIYNHSLIYSFNDELQITDSCTIRKDYFNSDIYSIFYNYKDLILRGNSMIYLYFPFLYSNEQEPVEPSIPDTLYCYTNNRLSPELSIKFNKNDLGNIVLYNIYRSSRYVFLRYNNNKNGKIFYYCHDIKTNVGYNIQDGYIDDINHTEKPVKIRPFNSDTEFFYYLHTKIKPGELEEPNPTLYIGRLKK